MSKNENEIENGHVGESKFYQASKLLEHITIQVKKGDVNATVESVKDAMVRYLGSEEAVNNFLLTPSDVLTEVRHRCANY